jgi:L,D-transpeptidase ErfK/SrfK
MSKRLTFTLALLLLLLIALAVAKIVEIQTKPTHSKDIQTDVFLEKTKVIGPITIMDTIRIKDYFYFLDSIIVHYDSLTNFRLSEHLLIKANPWIIDTLAGTDYYSMMERDSFMLDQREMIVLRPTDTLLFPDSLKAQSILESFKKTWIDINLPEYRLRIYEDSSLLQSFPIRIGQNKRKYLKMTDRITDLKTKTGKGHIIGFRKNPAFYNPVTGMRFHYTKRDDGNTTLMPQIPWIETEINGISNGQLIHPTTNPITLEKASSNGCIGVKEAHAWIIYYSCPVGTPIHIRYDLKIRDSDGAITELKDVYQLGT